ncbi:MAG: methyltransferase [Candidatus Heimdallarchaeota archaeon]|nr:methyltransferase [Candidatus Heimdallarchaeota archaeon]
MKQKDLEIFLTQLESFNSPKLHLEQYQTPPRIIAMILWRALQLGDLENKSIGDLCCGTGLFGIGAKILGAKDVLGIEIDKEAIEIAKRNAKKSEVKIDFINKDIRDVEKSFDTVFMNSPFGIQGTVKDQEFLLSALKMSKIIYSIHLYQEKNVDFLINFVDRQGREVKEVIKAEFELPKSYKFHKRKYHVIEVAILRCV